MTSIGKSMRLIVERAAPREQKTRRHSHSATSGHNTTTAELPVQRPHSAAARSILKRASDIAISVAVLVALSPVMLLTALVLRRTMGPNIIFAHERIGMNGRPFKCLKFRTMVSNGDEILRQLLATDAAAAREWRETRKLANDPRVTWFGHVLRKTSIDELPQFINVLRGEMSCVGPRPIVQEELDQRAHHARTYRSVRPGITGLWQVSGRSGLSERERRLLDSYYARKWSIWLDLAVLARTPLAVLRTEETS